MLKKLLKKNSKSLLSIYIAAHLLYCANANAVSLNEAFVSAYQTNPQIKSAVQTLQSVDEEMPSAISGLLPTVSSSLQRGQKDSKFATSGSSSTITSGITDTKSISVSQPLFSGGKTYASIKKAKHAILAAREQFRTTEQQVLLSAAVAYMDLVSNQEVYELAKNNQNVLAHHLEATKAQFDLGEVTQTDVAQSKASLAKANSDLISAEFTLESSKATYEKTIGQKPVNVTVPKTPIEIPGSVEELINIALANSPVVKLAEYTFDASKDNINIQKSVLFPQLSAFAEKERQFGTLSGSSTPSTIYTDTIGVNLSIPIYQAGSEYSQIRQAKHLAGKDSYNLSVARDETRESVIKAFQDFRVAQSIIKSNQSNVDASTIALDGVQQEANAGLRTTIEVLDAQQALFNAKAALIKSHRDEIVTSYNLLAQLGKLTVKELGLKVEAYNPEENYNKVKHQIIGF